MTRVLVCGGRAYGNNEELDRALTALHTERHFSLLIHGDARGADRMAGLWAMRNDVPVQAFPADWVRYSSAAGPIRNRQMLDQGKPDLVVAFRGGSGTANMILQARRAGVEIIDLRFG